MSDGKSMVQRPATRPRNRKKPVQASIPERLLARLWRKRAARQAWFRTRSGAGVRVIYPGRASSAAGPDFRNALLEVEGVGLVRGDVEIHVRQRDWESHGHGDDPNYNGVVLHAALEVDLAATALQSGRQAPVISLAPLLDGGDPPEVRPTSGLWKILGAQGYPQPDTPEGMASLLDRAGDDRFLAGSACFQRFLREQGPDQTLYEGLMEGLGYRFNQQPFLKLAARAPYAALKRAARSVPGEHRAEALESWLVTLSGFSPLGHGAQTPLPRAGFGASLSAEEWHCFRVRPCNHPRRRIAGAAGLLGRFLEEGLAAGLLRTAGSGSHRELTSALVVRGGPGRPGRSGGNEALIGRGRAADLAVNVVLPFLQALAGGCDGETQSRVNLELYHRFGKLQDNELTREMAEQLLEPAWPGVVTTARRQQGLLHLHSLLTGAS